MREKVLIIKDIRNWFWVTYQDWNTPVSLDTSKIKKHLENKNYNVEITSFTEFNFNKDYNGYFIIYGSYEDYCSSTKEYIEDVILWLEKQGAILIPKFEYFRAHDNKVMMELLRKEFKNDKLKTVNTRTYPSLESLGSNENEFPVVIKMAKGSGGNGVALARNKKELLKYAEKFSRLINEKQYIYLSIVNLKQTLFGKKRVPINNSKFIVQNYIPNLEGDNKVLIFGDHYFVLRRLNRDNDFRASGSGKFAEIDQSNIIELLEFARLCKREISSPFISIDIGFDGSNYHLIEFQCITFGFKAMSLSNYHFVDEGDSFKRIDKKVDPEAEFSYAVIDYIKNDNRLFNKQLIEFR